MRRIETELSGGCERERQLERAAVAVGGNAGEVQPELDLLRLELGRRPRAVDAQVHALRVAGIQGALDYARGPVQRAEARADDVKARLAPDRVGARLGADAFGRHLALGRRRALDDGLEKACRRALAHELVDVPQVEPELVVPDRVHARVVLAAEPPEPVAPLGDQDLPPSEGGRIRLLGPLERLLLEPRPSVGQQLPRDVVFRVANPGVQAGADPAARVQVAEALLGRVIANEVGDRGGDDVGRGFELGVEGVEEVVPVARVELPGVLAVQGDDRQVIPVPLLLADALQAPDQVARAVDRRHALVVEADRVRDLRVAEDHRQRSVFPFHLERPVKLVGSVDAAFAVAIEVRVERARQYLLVADHPVHVGLRRQPDHALPHRHLRRPHAGRAAPHQALEQALAQLDLPLRVLAM